MNPREAVNRFTLVRTVQESLAKDRATWEKKYNQPTWDYPALANRGFHELMKAVGTWFFAPGAFIGGLNMIITGIENGNPERVAVGIPAVVAGMALTKIAEKAFRHSRVIGKRIEEIHTSIGHSM